MEYWENNGLMNTDYYQYINATQGKTKMLKERANESIYNSGILISESK